MLDKKSDFLLTTLESIGDGVLATDLAGNIVFFNTAAEEITGWNINESMSKNVNDIFVLMNSKENSMIESPIEEVLKLGRKMGLKADSVLITKNKGIKYISASISPIKDHLGVISGVVIVFRDITKIRSVELKLKVEQDNSMKVFNSAPVGFVIMDENAIIEKANEAALGFLGRKEEESIGKRFGDAFFCKESLTSYKGCTYGAQCNGCTLMKSIYEALKSGTSTTNIKLNKNIVINDHEKVLWFKASITPIVHGNIKKVVMVLIDITDTKNKETALQESRDFYLNMFENFPTMVWKTDLKGNRIYVDKNWIKFTGKPREASLGFRWLDLLHPEDREKVIKLNKESIRNMELYSMEYRILDNDGEYRWIQAINRSFYDINGKLDGYIGIGLDITDRKVAEEGLNRYKILSEKVGDIIHFTDIEGNIIDVNKSALSSYGYSYEEFLKLNIRDLRAEGVITEELIKKCDKEGMSYETVHYRKDGSKFPIAISSKGADIEGKRVLVNIIRDITERKQKEKDLKEAKKAAEVANKAKSEFLANMSHEIRTPINGIVGMVELTLLTELDDEQRENLKIVKSCAKSLLSIINDILDFSKMEAKKLVIENINFDIESLVEETIKAHSPSAINKGIELNCSISSTIPKFLIGDPSRLKQILNNLISNAIKFTESGEVWVKVRRIRSDDGKVEVQFAVEDSGIGISEENIGRLFESFSQLDGSITRRFGGTGLGLVISKQLSEIMGGRLWVESKECVGSKFNFSLKFEKGTKVEEETVEPMKFKRVNREFNILLTEDSKVNQMVIERLLKEHGYLIDIACNGEEAVEMCEKKSYDLILMDIQMPVMDGIEATKRIRDKNIHTPIIAITAYALTGDREKFLSQGMDGYVSKPIKVDELFSTIEKHLSMGNKTKNLSDISVYLTEDGEISLKPKERSHTDKKDLNKLNELSKLINLLNQTVERAEFSLVESLAHKMKNLSNEIGLEELKIISFKIELATRRGEFDKVIEKAKRVNNVFEVFKKSIL